MYVCYGQRSTDRLMFFVCSSRKMANNISICDHCMPLQGGRTACHNVLCTICLCSRPPYAFASTFWIYFVCARIESVTLDWKRWSDLSVLADISMKSILLLYLPEFTIILHTHTHPPSWRFLFISKTKLIELFASFPADVHHTEEPN